MSRSLGDADSVSQLPITLSVMDSLDDDLVSLESLKTAHSWSPWDAQAVVQLEATSDRPITVEIPIHRHMKFKTIAAFPALVDAVGGPPQQLYRRVGKGRAGLVRIGSESLWSKQITSFFDGLPRCANTAEFLQRCAAAMDAACGFSKTTEPSARWEAKPYGSAVFALKDLLAVCHDSGTHPLVLRHSLPATLRALQHKWTEGIAVVTHALEVLCKLVEHPENAGWLGRLPLFEALVAARLLYVDGDPKAKPPSAIDDALLRFLAVLCRYPYGKHLIATSPIAAQLLMGMFLSNVTRPTGVGALRIIAHCTPLNPPHLMPLLAPIVPTLYQLALETTDETSDDLKLIVLSCLAGGLCRGIPPSPDAIHMVIQLALWSVCLDPDQHMFRIENRAEVEEYESKLREKEAKRAAYANLVGGLATPGHKPAVAGLRQNKSQRLCAPLAAYAVWSFIADVHSRVQSDASIDFDASQPRVIKVDPYANSQLPVATTGPPFRVPPVAITLRHQLARCIVVVEALMKIPNGPITEGICGAAANLLCIHNLVSKRSSVLASLDVVESALDWIARLAAKICRAPPASLLHRVGLNFLAVLAQSVTSPDDKLVLWHSTARSAILPAISELTQLYLSKFRLEPPPSSKAEKDPPVSGRQGGRGSADAKQSRGSSAGRKRGVVDKSPRDVAPAPARSRPTSSHKQRAPSASSSRSKGDKPEVSAPIVLSTEDRKLKEDILVALRLAAESVVLLCHDAGRVSAADIDVIHSLFKVPDPELLGTAAMAMWGLCVTPSNKPLAVKAGLVDTLSSWSAVLLLAASGATHTPLIADISKSPLVISVHERVLAALWQCITCPEGVSAVVNKKLLSGIIDVIRRPSAEDADKQYLAISVIWRTILSSPTTVLPIVMHDMLAETLFAYVAEESTVGSVHRLYALRCLLSLYEINRAAVLRRLIDSYGPSPMERLVLELLTRDAASKAEGAAMLACFHSKVSKRRICELGGIPRLLDLLKSCGEERTMLACLYTLLNLSTEPDNQKDIGKVALPVLFEVCRATEFHHLAAVATKIIANVSRHPANRTLLYKAELFYRRLDRNLAMFSLTDKDVAYLTARGWVTDTDTSAPAAGKRDKTLTATSTQAASSVLSRITSWLETLRVDRGEGKVEETIEIEAKLAEPPSISASQSDLFEPAFVKLPQVIKKQLPTAQPWALEGLDSAFAIQPPQQALPLHLTLCQKMSTLSEFMSEAETSSDDGGGLGYVVLPAGAGCGTDPGRTGPLGGKFVFGDDDDAMRTTAFDESAASRSIPPVLAVDNVAAYKLGGTVGEGDVPLVLQSVVAQKKASVSTLRARGDGVSTSNLNSTIGGGGSLKKPLASTVRMTPAPLSPVTTSTTFELMKSKSSIPTEQVPVHLRAGVEGDRLRKQLAASLKEGNREALKKQVADLHFAPHTASRDDNETGPKVTATFRVKETRRVAAKPTLSNTLASTIGSSGQFSSTFASLPELKDRKRPQTVPNKGTPGWWESASGSQWDVNVSSYTVTSIRHVHGELLAGAKHHVGKSGTDKAFDLTPRSTVSQHAEEAPLALSPLFSPSPIRDRRKGVGPSRPSDSTGKGDTVNIITSPLLEPVTRGMIGKGEHSLPLAALPAPLPAGQLKPLKVAVGNATGRHTVKFHWLEEGQHDAASIQIGPQTLKMSKFEHVPGATLCNDLYPHYQLPDGRIVHFFFMDLLHETVFEYVNAGPPVPNSLQSVRQQALSEGVAPMAMVLSYLPQVVSAPNPGVCPLTDLPQLRQEMHFIVRPMKLTPVSTVAESVVDSQPSVESVASVPSVQSQVTEIDDAVWGLRTETGESKDYTNKQKFVWMSFDKQWALTDLRKFVESVVDRSSPKPEFASASTIMDELKGTLKDFYVVVSQCFQYYCASSPITALPCTMNRFGLVEFINEMGFVGACGSPLPFKSVEAILRVMQLPDSITLPAFMSGLVKLGEQVRARLKGEPPSESVNDGLRIVLKGFVYRKFLPDTNAQDADRYRRLRLYCASGNEVLKSNLPLLTALFEKFADATTPSGRHKLMSLQSWLSFVSNSDLIDEYFTLREAQLCFLWSRLVYSDPNAFESNFLYFTDFLEALCRAADVRLIPLDALQGSQDALHWALTTPLETKERTRRLSLQWYESSERPLGDKLSKLLQHIYLALDVTMGQKCGMLTAQHVSRFTTKLATLPHVSVSKAGKVMVSPSDVLAALPVYTPGAEIVKEEPKKKRTPAPSPTPTVSEPAPGDASASGSVTPTIESPEDATGEAGANDEPMDEEPGDFDDTELMEGDEVVEGDGDAVEEVEEPADEPIE